MSIYIGVIKYFVLTIEEYKLLALNPYGYSEREIREINSIWGLDQYLNNSNAEG